MSLAIDVDKVEAVLLSDGQWYEVQPFSDGRSSFALDAYEYVQHHPTDNFKDQVLLRGGGENLLPATGATWNGADGKTFYCPLTSIMAVRKRTQSAKPRNRKKVTGRK